MRPTVKPGAAVLRRDAGHLQVGTSPGVVIADRPGLYPFLRGLDGTRDFAALNRHLARDHPDLDADVIELLAPLIAAGAVVDQPHVAAPRLRIAVTHDGPAGPFGQTVGALLTAVDLGVAPDPGLTIMITTGEPARAPLADAVQLGLPHLVVSLAGDSVRIGPFVVPGQSACLGCFDLDRARWDPAWLALVPQFGRPLRHDLAPLTHHAAATEVAAECLRFARGEAPRTTSEIVLIGDDRVARTIASTQFHPRCACSLLSVA